MDTKTSTYLKGISSSKPSCLGAHVSCWECNLNVHHSNKMKQTIIFTPCSGVKALDFQKSNCTDGTFHPTLQKVFPKVPSMKSKRSKEVGQASNILDATKKIKQILYTLLITSHDRFYSYLWWYQWSFVCVGEPYCFFNALRCSIPVTTYTLAGFPIWGQGQCCLKERRVKKPMKHEICRNQIRVIFFEGFWSTVAASCVVRTERALTRHMNALTHFMNVDAVITCVFFNDHVFSWKVNFMLWSCVISPTKPLWSMRSTSPPAGTEL